MGKIIITHTQEQLDIINSPLRNITVNAGPGMGKSHLLLSIAEHNKNETNQILCFNSMIRKELMEKAKQQHIYNIKIDTFHSMAFNFFKVDNTIKGFGKRKNNLEPFDYFSMERILQRLNMDYESDNVNFYLVNLTNFFKSKLTINEYCNKNVLQAKEFIEIFKYLLNDISAPLFHEFYIKCFQLVKPLVHLDKILVDEFQDVSECYLDITESLSRNSKRVQVGDKLQKIYGYNGALGIQDFDYALTQSFRFGECIAKMCNYLIEHFTGDMNYKIRGMNKNQIIVQELPKNENKTIIFRTNAGLIERLIEETGKGVKCCISESIMENITNLYRLSLVKNGISCLYRGVKFNSENLIYSYYNKSRDKVLSIYMQLSKQFGNSLINVLETIIKNISLEKENTEIEFLTSHRCKGLQINNVEIADDFPTIEKLLEMKQKNKIDFIDEVYILYVAITRCDKNLKLNKDLKEVFKC